jgi:hypothetical protein
LHLVAIKNLFFEGAYSTGLHDGATAGHLLPVGFCSSESNSRHISIAVENGEILAHEEVTEDPKRTTRGRDVKRHHSRAALVTEFTSDDVILVRKGEFVKTLGILHDVDDLRKVLCLRASDTVLIKIDGAEELGQTIGRASKKRGTGINNDLAGAIRADVEVFAINLDIVKLELPVHLLGNLDIVDFSVVEIAGGGAKTQHGVLGREGGIVEREGISLQKLLLHDVVKNRDVSRFAQTWEGKTQNSVEFTRDKNFTNFGGDLTESLFADLNWTDTESILS